MAVRSRRIAGPSVVNAGSTLTLYTVPAGRTLVVRGISVVNTSATAGIAVVDVNGVPGWQAAVPNYPAAVVMPLYMVLNPGDVLALFNASAAASFYVSAYGALLLGAPS